MLSCNLLVFKKELAKLIIKNSDPPNQFDDATINKVMGAFNQCIAHMINKLVKSDSTCAVITLPHLGDIVVNKSDTGGTVACKYVPSRFMQLQTNIVS